MSTTVQNMAYRNITTSLALPIVMESFLILKITIKHLNVINQRRHFLNNSKMITIN